jgi:hypothetical protein
MVISSMLIVSIVYDRYYPVPYPLIHTIEVSSFISSMMVCEHGWYRYDELLFILNSTVDSIANTMIMSLIYTVTKNHRYRLYNFS